MVKLVGFIMEPITILVEDPIIQPEVMVPRVQLRVLITKVAVVVALPRLGLKHQEIFSWLQLVAEVPHYKRLIDLYSQITHLEKVAMADR